MQDDKILAAKQKITSILKIRGPSLPVRVASQIGLSSLFAGALLSELAKEKAIRISNMKVGSSPLYFLKGQESALENFHSYLPGKEKEAFLLLKEKRILADKAQAPAIRVALRNLKDFAFPFLKDNEVFWRFHTMTEGEIRELDKKGKLDIKIKKEIKPIPEIKIKPEIKKPLVKDKQLDIGLKTAIEKPKIEKIAIKKEKPQFILKTINSLKGQGIEILEERDVKKKEFSGIVRINSILGPIRFFCIAKDKKRITENDLRLALQKSQALKMPALVLIPGEINKKALEYAEKWSSLIKLKRLN